MADSTRAEILNRIPKWFASWLALAIVIALATSGPYRKYVQLSRSGVATWGLVTGLFSRQRQSIAYRFRANGQMYEGVGRLLSSNYPQIGDRVVVYYLPSDPGMNCPDDPNRLRSHELPLLILFSLLGSSVIVLIADRWRW